MKVVVLGAGVTGVASAWFLREAGHEVTVIDRQPAAALETSFANGGQISVSHAQPWANPAAPLKVMKWLGRPDAPLLFRLRCDWQQWLWGLTFLRECHAARTRHNIRQLVHLGLYSRAMLRQLRERLGLQYAQRTQGILHFYTDPAEFEAAEAPARLMREHGCESRQVSADECCRIEPALAQCRDRLAGGYLSPGDESGDAHAFTQALARHAAEAGVQFSWNTRIVGIERAGNRIAGLRLASAEGLISAIKADAYVLCLGPYSAAFARQLDIALRIYPAKGYSVTLPVTNPQASFQVSLTDDAHKLVFSRLGDRLRIAGTAELNGFNTDLNLVRCDAIVRRVRELFPQMTDGQGAQYWTGLRPSTPSNVPYIGRSKIGNLFLNTGHGTLGWTHACGSGRAISDIVSARRPELDFAFCGMA